MKNIYENLHSNQKILIYEMLNIPRDLFIPIFAAARLVGWLAHDIENLLYCNKIVRPAFRYVGDKLDD